MTRADLHLILGEDAGLHLTDEDTGLHLILAKDTGLHLLETEDTSRTRRYGKRYSVLSPSHGEDAGQEKA